ncbi:putative glutathione S-transferase, N-terminal domain [Lyophyllum shimeji]|uniref:glutathione transferase n=1 Tax=Lyophyllum shimeji TaxID=47721 RepID=A0A9P3PVR4_LYOSH|nr:putative glutathione S-transferase, N-terminal domain [Lyophyllum shimeji]
MVLKLYGHAMSTCSQRILVVLLEKQVPYELIEVDFANREHKSPEYLAKQPFGQIPYIDDDGFILYETRAICRYIAAKYADQGTKLLPTGLKENALFEQAASIEQSNFEPSAHGAVFENLFKLLHGLVPDQTVFEEHLKKLDAKLDAYEVILSKQKYLAGDELTLADLFHLPHGFYLAQAGSNIMETKPNVARWFKEISSRPSWEAVKMEIKIPA